MVDTSGTWVEFVTTTNNVVLYGTELNVNFDFVSDMVNKGITDANIAEDGIADGAVIAADVIREEHLDYADANYGPRVMQIGKALNTYQQLYVQVTAEVATVAATNTDITIDYTDGNVVDGAEINFAIAPTLVTAYVITAGTDAVAHPKVIGTDTMQINFKEAAGNNITETQTLYWAVVGDIA